MHRLKPLFFVQLTLLSNNLVLSSYLNGILLRIMVFLVMGKSVESIEEQKETDRTKTLRYEENKKRRTRGKSNNKNTHFWF